MGWIFLTRRTHHLLQWFSHFPLLRVIIVSHHVMTTAKHLRTPQPPAIIHQRLWRCPSLPIFGRGHACTIGSLVCRYPPLKTFLVATKFKPLTPQRFFFTGRNLRVLNTIGTTPENNVQAIRCRYKKKDVIAEYDSSSRTFQCCCGSSNTVSHVSPSAEDSMTTPCVSA